MYAFIQLHTFYIFLYVLCMNVYMYPCIHFFNCILSICYCMSVCIYARKLWERFQPLLRPPLPPPSAPPISTPIIQREFPEEFSPSAKGSKFNTRTKTIIEAMARDDGRDGTQGGEGREGQEEKIVSPKRLVADIWHLLSYHSISKLPGMVWYGRRSAEMPVAIAEDSDDSLRMLSAVNGTDSTMLPLPPSRVSLQPLLLSGNRWLFSLILCSLYT